MKEREIELKAREALENLFNEVPFVSGIEVAQQDRAPSGPDYRVSLRLRQGQAVVLVEVQSFGQPRFAREAVNRLRLLKEDYPDAYLVFMAPYISKAAADICRESGVGYIDLAGNAYLAMDSIFISRQGKKNPYVSTRALRSLYRPKSSRILRVLLMTPGKYWKLQELSNEADVSLGQASNVKKGLKNREWIEESCEGFRLFNPRALLDEWAAGYSFRKNEIFEFYSLQGTAEIEQKIADVCRGLKVEYALSVFSGAARIAPAVRYKRVMVYVARGIDEVAREAGLKRVETGANVILAIPYDEGVFYDCTEVQGITVASPVQVYLDLYAQRGRGQEAADMILKKVMEPKW